MCLAALAQAVRLLQATDPKFSRRPPLLTATAINILLYIGLALIVLFAGWSFTRTSHIEDQQQAIDWREAYTLIVGMTAYTVGIILYLP